MILNFDKWTDVSDEDEYCSLFYVDSGNKGMRIFGAWSTLGTDVAILFINTILHVKNC